MCSRDSNFRNTTAEQVQTFKQEFGMLPDYKKWGISILMSISNLGNKDSELL